VSFVNALLSGSGCTGAVSLGCEAVVRLERAAPGEIGTVSVPGSNDTPIVRAALETGVRTLLPGARWHAELELRSGLPWARGLKSSSAVSVAILQAIARAAGLSVDDDSVARRSADLAQGIGLSATGAFDDARAAAGGGVVVTENAERRLLAAGQVDPELRAVVWVPEESHPPSTETAGRFARSRTAGREAIRLALEGRYLEAMEINTREVERAVGLDYSHLRRRLRERGAQAAGVSGMGPTLVAVVRADRADALAGEFPRHRGATRVLGFRPPGPIGPGAFDAAPWGEAERP
jgi:shikimate kinase